MAGQTKFTPEKLGQIRTLVESGKSRQEIAELLGVTVGSLQVTCSRLGISLRRIGRRPSDETAARTSGSIQQSRIAEVQQDSQSRQDRAATPHRERSRADASEAKFAVKMQYKGEERITDLPFTQDMIRQLAFEAQLRDMRIGDFLGELFITTMKKDLFQRVLEPSPNQASKHGHTAGSTGKESGPTAGQKKYSEAS